MPRAKEILIKAVRSRWAVLLAGALLLVLMEMTFLKMDVGMPALDVAARQPRHSEIIPLSKIEEFCSTNQWTGLGPATGMISAFYTTNFVPPPPPPPAPKPPPAPAPVVVAPTPPPAPPPPTTKKVPVLYQGFSESAAGFKQAFIKVGDALLIATNGATVIADFTIANFDLKSLTLRNSAHTNVFAFNSPKDIEVPVK